MSEKTEKKKLHVVKGGKKPTAKSPKKKVTKKKRKFNETAFYEKYPWVVKGSVKDVKPGSTVDNIKAVHGRVCQIKCQKTGELRTVNVQDAFQTKYSKKVQQQMAKERAANNRKKTKTSKSKTKKTG